MMSNGESALRYAFAYASDVEPISALFKSPMTIMPAFAAISATSKYSNVNPSASKKAELIFMAGTVSAIALI